MQGHCRTNTVNSVLARRMYVKLLVQIHVTVINQACVQVRWERDHWGVPIVDDLARHKWFIGYLHVRQLRSNVDVGAAFFVSCWFSNVDRTLFPAMCTRLVLFRNMSPVHGAVRACVRTVGKIRLSVNV